MKTVWRKVVYGLVVATALGGLVVASTALAQDSAQEKSDRPPEVSAQGPKGPRAGRPFQGRMRKAAENTMRAHREIFYDGRTITVDLDRGEVAAVGESSVTVKYLDGSTAEVKTVGEVKVCASGKPDASLADLQAGKKVGIHRVTNLPGGDLTVVVQAADRSELVGCKGMLKDLKDRLRPEGVSESPEP